MGMFQGITTSASGLTAQRLRMDVISSNIANAETTRGEYVDGEWQPYKRKSVVLQETGGSQFSNVLNKAIGDSDSSSQGVIVSKIIEDETESELVYDPDHEDANEDGYVLMPNVDTTRETVDLISTTRSYEANVTALNASKGMLMKALEIGK